MGKMPKKADLESLAGKWAERASLHTIINKSVNAFQMAHQSNDLTFSSCDVESLPKSSKEYVSSVLVITGLKFEVCDLIFDSGYLFKIDDPLVGFLYHHSNSANHIWMNKELTESLNASGVYWYLQCLKKDNAAIGRICIS